MAGIKLIISGLSEVDRERFSGLVDAVRTHVAPDVQSKIDASVLGRFAITSFVKAHNASPQQLAKLLGFEVTAP